MKRLILLVPVLAVLTLSGCAGSSVTDADMADMSIATSQSAAQAACYAAQAQIKPDMAAWSPEQIAQYELIQKLGDANKMLAKVSLDPCHDAGGTNVYDAKIVALKEGTKRQKNWMDFGLGIATKALYGFVAYEVADSYKTWVNRNDDIAEVALEDEVFAEPITLDPASEPITF